MAVGQASSEPDGPHIPRSSVMRGTAFATPQGPRKGDRCRSETALAEAICFREAWRSSSYFDEVVTGSHAVPTSASFPTPGTHDLGYDTTSPLGRVLPAPETASSTRGKRLPPLAGTPRRRRCATLLGGHLPYPMPWRAPW